MSGLLMGFAFYVDVPITTKMVLLALCDHANDLGDRVHPGNPVLMAKTRLSERALRECLSALKDGGWIDRLTEAVGRGQFHEYRINVRALELAYKKGALRAAFSEKGAPDRTKGGATVQERGRHGVVSGPVSSCIEPEAEPPRSNRQEPPSRRVARAGEPVSVQAFLDSLKANPAYRGIDLERESCRMDAWLSLPQNRGRKKTSRFVLNWLNKIDRPLDEAPAMAPKPFGLNIR